MLRSAIETDPLVASNDMPMVDANGARSKLTLWKSRRQRYVRILRSWQTLGERGEAFDWISNLSLSHESDAEGTASGRHVGMAPRFRLLVPGRVPRARQNAVRDSRGGQSHRREWLHATPERLASAWSFSARCKTGEQAGVDQEALGKAVKRFPKVYATMRPGDVLFTHSNLLHSSAPASRRAGDDPLIVAYNAIENPPRPDTICPLPAEAPLEPLFDDAEILTRGVVRIDPARDFLDHARNAAQFSAGSTSCRSPLADANHHAAPTPPTTIPRRPPPAPATQPPTARTAPNRTQNENA